MTGPVSWRRLPAILPGSTSTSTPFAKPGYPKDRAALCGHGRTLPQLGVEKRPWRKSLGWNCMQAPPVDLQMLEEQFS